MPDADSPDPPPYVFTDAQLARLANYRGAIVRGVYSDVVVTTRCGACGTEAPSGTVPAGHNGHRTLYADGSEVQHIWCSGGDKCPVCQ